LVYLHECGCEFNGDTTLAAVQGRSFECLKYLIDSGCNLNQKTIQKAAQIGDIGVIHFLHQNGCRLNRGVAAAAARQGHVEILQYLEANACNMDVTTTRAAVQGRSLECLLFLLSLGYETDDDTFILAAKIGDVGIFELLHLNEELELELDEDVAYAAALKGRLGILQYFKTFGGVWNFRATHAAVKGRKMDCLKFLFESGCEIDHIVAMAAVQGRNMDCLKFLLASGCEINSMVMESAGHIGDLQIVKLLHQNGCVLDETFSYIAASHGHLDILKYFKDHDGEWHPEVTHGAITGRNLECLKFLHESCGQKLERSSSSDAAIFNGDVDILEYLHRNGCDLGFMTVLCMCWQTNFECMVYLLKNSEEWKTDIEGQINTMNWVAKFGDLQKIKFLREHGCSCDIQNMKKICNENLEYPGSLTNTERYTECLCYLNSL
jgi:ankyrin repeat protein